MRTDRTFACTECRIRCWPVRRCPACGETRALVDLEREPLRIGERPRAGSARSDAAIVSGTLGGIGLTLAAGAATSGMLAVAEVALMLGVPMTLLGVLLRPKRLADLPMAALPYRPLESPVVRARADRVAEMGRVRARETLIAPLSGARCVAWRISGEGPHGPIDDGRATRFAIARVAEGHEAGEPLVEVDASIATLDLPFPDVAPAPLASIDTELAAWLLARGADVSASPPSVREAVLREDDLVEVIGTPRRETRADGYRGSRTRDVLSDLPGSPLIVRAAAPDGRRDAGASVP